MVRKSRLVFFGNERLATGLGHTDTPAIKALIEEGYEVAAIVSNYAQARSRSARKLEITEVAEAHNIPLLLPTHPRDIKDDIKKLDADFGVLVAYGKIIPQEIIDTFPKGIINLHPSLLPKYRGPTPIEQAILDGAKETGISIMRLVSDMDAGPVYASTKVPLDGMEPKADLAAKLLNIGAETLIKHLPRILENPDDYTPQDDSRATYTMLISKDDGIVNWEKSAEQIEREIRAYAGWPKSRAKLLSKDVIITKARVAKDEADGALVVECQLGWLEIQELTAPSGRNMSGSEFLRGYSKN